MQDFWNTFLWVFSTFMPVINPVGGALIFLSMTAGADRETRRTLVNRIVIYSALLLALSLLAGQLILSFFGISMGVLHLGGGLVLMAAGWNALNADCMGAEETNVRAVPRSKYRLLSMAFYPFTLPLTIGPGMISVATAVGSTAFARGWPAIAGVVAATIVSLLIVWFVFHHCDKITKSIGAGAVDALTRIFAFIALCVGISHLWEGLSELFLNMGA